MKIIKTFGEKEAWEYKPEYFLIFKEVDSNNIPREQITEGVTYFDVVAKKTYKVPGIVKERTEYRILEASSGSIMTVNDWLKQTYVSRVVHASRAYIDKNLSSLSFWIDRYLTAYPHIANYKEIAEHFKIWLIRNGFTSHNKEYIKKFGDDKEIIEFLKSVMANAFLIPQESSNNIKYSLETEDYSSLMELVKIPEETLDRALRYLSNEEKEKLEPYLGGKTFNLF